MNRLELQQLIREEVLRQSAEEREAFILNTLLKFMKSKAKLFHIPKRVRNPEAGVEFELDGLLFRLTLKEFD